MTDVRSLNCPTCGAALSASAATAARAVCEYCNTPLAIARPTAAHPLHRETAYVAPSAPSAPAQHEGTTVRLHSVGRNKIGLIKVVRELTGMGLADSKNAVERTPPIDVYVSVRNVDLRRALRDLEKDGCQYELVGTAEYAAAPMPAAPMPEGECVVVLEHTGPQKIAVIKEIRELSLCGLKEAKDLSEQTPSRFPLANQRVRAGDVVGRFAAVGARVRLEPR